MKSRVSRNSRDAFGFAFCVLLAISAHGSAAVDAQQALTVEHGLTIPNAVTPWAVDSFRNHPQLVPIHHSTIRVNRHRGRNIFGSVAGSFLYRPIVSSELDGVHARAQLHTRTPIFYLLYEEDADPGDNTRDADSYSFVIEHVTVAKKKRVVDVLSFNSLTLHAKRDDKLVQTTVTKVPGGWLRIEPMQPMDEGEYCILPVPKTNGTYSTEVFDFGIDPHAPNEKDAIVAARPVPVS